MNESLRAHTRPCYPCEFVTHFLNETQMNASRTSVNESRTELNQSRTDVNEPGAYRARRESKQRERVWSHCIMS